MSMVSSPTQHDRPVMHWVPVVDEQGRTRMEMRWTVVPSTPESLAPASAA